MAARPAAAARLDTRKVPVTPGTRLVRVPPVVRATRAAARPGDPALTRGTRRTVLGLPRSGDSPVRATDTARTRGTAVTPATRLAPRTARAEQPDTTPANVPGTTSGRRRMATPGRAAWPGSCRR